MKTTYFVGTDIGTSATKSVLVDLDGKILASETALYEVSTPQPLWAEQWPDVWYNAVIQTIRGVVEKSRVSPGEIGGLTISGLYGGSGIPCDGNMKPLHPCLIWMDKRAQAEADWVRQSIGEKQLFDITENYIDPYYGYTKILWLKNHVPEVWAKTKFLVTPYAYCAYQLTGKMYYDHCSAGNIGGIYDMKKRTWSHELLKHFDIPGSLFGDTLVDSSEIIGRLHKAGASATGLLEGTPVGAGGVDCVVAMLSAGGIRHGEHVAMIGTSMAWGLLHDGANSSRKTINMPYVVDVKDKTYSFAGATTSGGIVTWFADELTDRKKLGCGEGHGNLYRALDDAAAKVAPGSDGLVMLPYFMGERAPVWNPQARGALYGLTLYHTQAHIFRAILEAVAYSLRTGIECAADMRIPLVKDLILVGGVTKSNLWKHIFADVTNCNIRCAVGGGEAAYGDAFLAALATGAVRDLNAVQSWVAFEPGIAPDERNVAVYDKYYRMYESYYRSLEPIIGDFAKL